MKKYFLMLVCAVMTFAFCACSSGQEMNIEMSDTEINVNGQPAEYLEGSAVYLSGKIEQHPDVKEEYKELENTVINITQPGKYTVTGKRENTMIFVQAEKNKKIELVLDNAEISCMTAPAILVTCDEDGAENCAVDITLADGSVNKIKGSHIARVNDDDVKYDGAISASASLNISGGGALELESDNEGIETKMHLTINDGNIRINSANDALNASNDGESVITINGGYIYCAVGAEGEEGDGIDSNGSIVINGGTVLSYANPNSADSGLDADEGTTINGGTVVASGNMADRINQDSKQKFAVFSFKEKQEADALRVLTDENGKPVAAFSIPTQYSCVQISVPEIKNQKYKLYSGGVIVADFKDGIYDNITSYSPGELLQHGGAMERPSGMGKPDVERPQVPEGIKPGEKPEMPEGMKPGERPQQPEGEKAARPGKGGGFGGMRGEMSREVSDIFEIGEKGGMFMNITAAEN